MRKIAMIAQRSFGGLPVWFLLLISSTSGMGADLARAYPHSPAARFSALSHAPANELDSAERERPLKPYLFAAIKDRRVSFLFGTIHIGVDAKELPDFVVEAIGKVPVYADEDGYVDEATAEAVAYDNWDFLPKIARSELAKTAFARDHSPSALIDAVNATPPEQLCFLALSLVSYEFGTFGMMDTDLEKNALLRYGRQPRKLDDDALVARAIAAARGECDIDSLFAKKSLSTLRTELGKMRDRYRTGRLKYARDDSDPILAQRNRSWIPKLESFHQEGGFFATFGADHLGGRQGVLDLLRKGGYAIEPITDRLRFDALCVRHGLR